VHEGELEEPLLAEGWLDERVREEFPDLRLRTAVIERGSGRTPQEVRHRLRILSDRFRGAQAIALRRSPVPSAYRVFFRHVGLDPDTTRTPVEEAAVQRLVKGAFQATNLLDDALLIALVETGIPLWAVDADRSREPLGIGTAPDGRLAVCDADGPIATLFGPVDPAHGVTRDTARMLIYTIQVPGVPGIFVDEAMWTCLGVLQDAG
jgi:DNA/RNA-binding domain of Phe-tRNA-synthetase-like protein